MSVPSPALAISRRFNVREILFSRKAFQFSLALLLTVSICNSSFAFKPLSRADFPETFTAAGKTYTFSKLSNPHSSDEAGRPKRMAEGAKLYYKHCFLCHGDLLTGRGLYANRLTPPPANFLGSGSIFTKPQAYSFWRIMKGGPGLPKSHEPWNSAMPAWEGILSEKEVWTLVDFLYERASQYGSSKVPGSASLERGKEVFGQKCSVCHGPEGAGDGVAAEVTSPRPRDLTKGHYKLRSTPFGKIPTDEDLHDMLTRGMPGTTMPSWKHLDEVDLQSLVLYLKELGKKKFERAVRKKKFPQPISVPPAPPFDLKSMERGRQLFLQNCSGCHGVRGRGDGDSTKKIVDIKSDAIRPRNLSKPWTFRRGFRREDIFLTLRTGLSTTAMPRFSDRVHPDQNIWDLVNYVQTLSPGARPAHKSIATVPRIEGPVPSTPEDPSWKQVPSFYYPVVPQIMQGEKAYFTTVDSLWVQAVHNGQEIAFRVLWDDPTFDPALKQETTVVESPPPPLPPHLRVMEDDPGEEPPPIAEPSPIPDSLALQFPVTVHPDGESPYFLGGDETHPVHLWKWQSNPNSVTEMNAKGLGTEKPQAANHQSISSKVSFRYGQYQLVMKRPLTTPDPNQDVQFSAGGTFPVAFNVWDGNEKESGTRRGVSSWFAIKLD